MMSHEQFELLINKLDTLIKISVINAFQGKSTAEVIGILSELGFGNKEIAAILGTTPNYVAIARHRTKKQRIEQKKETQESKIEAKPDE